MQTEREWRIYGLTREELYDRVEDAQKKIAEVVFHRENPTVEEYCENGC
jgi:hypothetical protein